MNMNTIIEGVFESDDEVFEPLMEELCKNLKFFPEGEIVSEASASVFKKEPCWDDPNYGAIIEFKAVMRFFDTGVFTFSVRVLACVDDNNEDGLFYYPVADLTFKEYPGKPEGFFEFRSSNGEMTFKSFVVSSDKEHYDLAQEIDSGDLFRYFETALHGVEFSQLR